MNETVFDKEMKDMLHRCADELHAPDKLKTRVDFALKNGSSRPRRRWGRRLIALAAVAAITVTGAFAAGAFGSITSHSWSDQRLSMEQTQQHMEDAGAALTLPETIGDFTFSHGYDVAATAKSATGKSEQVDEVNAEYEKDGVTLNFNAHKTYTVFSEEENSDPEPDEVPDPLTLNVRSRLSEEPPENPLPDEIREVSAILIGYGFDFMDLTEVSPKAGKTRTACAKAIRYLLYNPLLMEGMRRTRTLPIKILEKNAEVPRKILERHRKYIIAAAEILGGDFPGLAAYLHFVKEKGIG